MRGIRLCNRIRRWLGLRPIMVLYTQRDDGLSDLVTPVLKSGAKAAGYQVREKRL